MIFLIFSLKAGGIETHLLRFLQYFEKKIEATIIVKNGKKGDLYHEYIKAGASIIFLNMGFLNVRSWIKLFKCFTKEKCKTVCDFGANFAGIPLTIARIAGVNKRIAFYRQSSHQFKLSIINLAYANFVNFLVYKNATVILANSWYAQKYYFGKSIDNRFKVINNGVNKELFEIKESRKELREYFGLPENKIIIGHTGRVSLIKNHKTILDVAFRVCSDINNVVFVLAGDGTQELPVQNGVITLGYCTEIPKLLKTFDLYYFPSISEGQPNALIEALITGLPFVASDIEPIKECIPEKHFSQLVSANDVEKSVEKIKEIIKSNNKNQYSCREWAIEVYDADTNFGLFYNELI